MSIKKWFPVCVSCDEEKKFTGVIKRLAVKPEPCIYCKKLTYQEIEGYMEIVDNSIPYQDVTKILYPEVGK